MKDIDHGSGNDELKVEKAAAPQKSQRNAHVFDALEKLGRIVDEAAPSAPNDKRGPR